MAMSKKPHEVHYLRAGRQGKSAWLSVDGNQNVSGAVEGTKNRLDVPPILYIGKKQYSDYIVTYTTRVLPFQCKFFFSFIQVGIKIETLRVYLMIYHCIRVFMDVYLT